MGKNYSDMTDNQLRVEVAKALGWMLWANAWWKPDKTLAGELPRFSTDNSAAWQLVEKCGLSLVKSVDGWYAVKVQDIVHGNVRGTDCPQMMLIGKEGERWEAQKTPMRAACIAFLLSNSGVGEGG